MLKYAKKILTYSNIKFLSLMANFALIITSLAVNQRCWYVMYEDKLPPKSTRLKKRKESEKYRFFIP